MSARADVAFTTFAPPMTFVDNIDGGGDYINGSNMSDLALAVSFVPTVSGNLASIDVGVEGYAATLDGNFNLVLYANNPSGGPLTTGLMTSTLLTDPNPNSGYGSPSIISSDYSGPLVSLSAGTTYWLALAPADSNTFEYLGLSTLSITASVYDSFDGGETYESRYQGTTTGLPAFQVNVSSVPEPSGLALLTLGVGILLARRQRRKAA